MINTLLSKCTITDIIPNATISYKKSPVEVYFVHGAHAIVNLKPFESRSSALLLCS